MEIWKDVVGYEGLYKVSNRGSVRSSYCGRNITPKKNCKGYLWFALYKNGASRAILAHRLVAEAFIPNPNKLPQVNHKDENPLNNGAINLEWCTPSYNTRYSMYRWIHKIRGNKRKTKRTGVPYKTSGKIMQIDAMGNVVKTWESFVQIKHEMMKNESSIRDCCVGRRKTAYGFKWAFACEDTPRENAV